MIIKPSSVDVLFKNCYLPDNIQYIKQDVSLSVPKFQIDISEQSTDNLMKLLRFCVGNYQDLFLRVQASANEENEQAAAQLKQEI